MRKDVRTGFAVGSILFVGILVYVLFFTGGTPKDPNSRSQANATGASGSGGSGASAASAGAAPVTPVTPVNPVPETPKPQPPPAVTETPRPTPPPVEQPPVALTPTTRSSEESTATAANDITTTPVDETPRPIASGSSFDWDAALNNGVARSLLGQTTTPDPDRVSTNAGPIARDEAPVPAPEPAPSASAAREYVLKQGDTFWTIAKAEYGSSSYFSHIVRANPNINPSRIKAGQTIILPARDQVVPGNGAAASANASTPTTRPVRAAAAAAADPATEYRVQTGENLYIISKKLYGRGDRSAKLYEANKELIGPNPNALKKGMVLKLPEPPTGSTVAGTSNN